MQDEMNKAFATMPSRVTIGATPAMDLADHGAELIATLDLPGVRKEDIRIHCTQNYLQVSAQSSERQEEKKKNYYFSERSSASFSRGIRLPAPVWPEKAKSTFKNGVLEIRLPKKHPESKDRGHAIKID